jgi:glycosyltransferase involved in cell wall biosynthesis
MKTLLVTFPIDLGNRTYEKNLHKLFETDMDFFQFAGQHVDELDKGIDYPRSVKDRILSIRSLRNRVKLCMKENGNVVFHGLSPAFLSFGSWKPQNTSILLDWTRLLYPWVLGKKMNKNWLFYLHRYVLNRCPKIMCMTQAVFDNLVEHYKIDPNQLFKVPAPFDVMALNISPRPTPLVPRVLFVGGDLKRKGGDVILKNINRLIKANCVISMLTNDESANVDGVTFLSGLKYGTKAHRQVFEDNDILILPTKLDSYPQAIGEAAAAGLAVITTKFALGASEVVINNISGYIVDDQQACIDALLSLLSNTQLIDDFKNAGYDHMHSKFSNQSVKQSYLDIIYNTHLNK